MNLGGRPKLVPTGLFSKQGLDLLRLASFLFLDLGWAMYGLIEIRF